MRTFLACTFALLVSVLSWSTAQARAGYDYGGYRHAVMWHYAYQSRPIYRRHSLHRLSHRYGRHLARRHFARQHFRHLSRHVWRRPVYDRGQIVAHPAGCPRFLFCGCGASIEVFGSSVRDLWLVANWYRFPRTAPAPGMAVLWGTHVAIIREYYGDGTALLYDANSGQGLTRVHRRSIAGLAVVNPHPGRKAKLISWASTSPP
jgi:hypothetical protein